MVGWLGLIRQYRDYLPPVKDKNIVTLLEGNTPLVPSRDLSERTGLDVYLKVEGLNPTGSFKDRGMTMAISQAKEEGAKCVMCASTGNTSASAAAYAARSASMDCIVIIPEGKIALGKLAQAMIHGAKVIQIKGNFDDALNIVREICDKHPVQLVNSINPFRIEGQKTASFEICEVLGDAPTFHCIPVGNAGNITAYWRGYTECKAHGKAQQLPKMLGFQAEGAAPIVNGAPVENPETIATAIRIGNPASWKEAEAARDESDGLIEAVTEEQILYTYQLLASKTGVFVEPASAASVAGMLLKASQGYFDQDKDAHIVCTVTGHGLKDPNCAISQVDEPVVCEGDVEEIVKEIGL